jgi:hypothetical protein
MAPQIAWKLRPDLWASGQDCGLDMHPLRIDGAHRVSVKLAGLDAPVLVLTRSMDDIAIRIQWITGHRVLAIADYTERPVPVATTSPDPAAYRQARIEYLKRLALQEPPTHECARRKDILAARAELERLEPTPIEPEGDIQGDHPESAFERAGKLILDMLESGPADAAGILAAAEADGLSERTMQRAAEALGVVKSKAGFSGGWVWALPEAKAA